jgi:hypothetical protein
VKTPSIIAWLAALLPSVVGCGDQIRLGVEPIDWRADHETDDFSQWQDGANDGTFVSSDGALAIVEDPVHSGHYAVRSSIDTLNNPSCARLYRQNNLPKEAYYSVWFYIPKPYLVGDYWNVFEFQGRTDPSNTNTATPVWSLDLRQQSNDELLWYLWDGAGRQELKPNDPVVAPVGRWFHVEALVRQATDRTGRVAFWIDGEPFIDESGVATVPTNWMSWSVGSVAGHMPQPAELYIDDAMIWCHGACQK